MSNPVFLRLRKVIRSSLIGTLGIALLVSLLVITAKNAGVLEFAELSLYDWYVRLQPLRSIDSRIALVTMSETDIQNQGKWPLTDSTVDRLLRILLAQSPCAIGLDIYRDMPVPPGTKDLEKTLLENDNIVVSMKFGGEGNGIEPPRVLKDTEQVGFTDTIVDPGGVVRRGLLFMDDGRTVYYAFGLRVALLYARSRGILPKPDPINPEWVRLGQRTIRPLGPNDGGYVRADARGYQFLLDYKGARHSFPSFSLTEVLDRRVDLAALTGRVVIIGTTAEGVKDFFFTPFSRGLSSAQQVPGIVLHGHVVSQLLRSAFDGAPSIATWSDRCEEAFAVVWAVLGALVGIRVRSPWRFSLIGLLGLCLLALTGYLLLLASVWLPVVPPTIAWVTTLAIVAAYAANKEKKERAQLMQLFSKHVSPQVAQSIWDQREQFLDGGRPKPQKLTVTVIFTDLQGFTSAAEGMSPQQVMEWLNLYQEAMAGHVMRYGGVIDTYTGDGLKADFGVPIERTTEQDIRQDVRNAVRCALDMKDEVDRLNRYLQEQGWPTITLRVGIYTGPVVVGCLGSADRLKYTSLGDTVNVASRLESLERNLAPMDGYCRILIGERTREYLEGSFIVETVGDVKLKGKTQTIRAYRLLGVRAEGEAREVRDEKSH